MTDMPDGTLYGTITGSVSAFIGDTESDTNDLPDRVPVPAGSTISFEPSISYVIVESSPKRDIIFATPETVMLDDDGGFSVKLVACDSPNLNPTGWYYTVRLNVPGRAALTARVQVPGGGSITLGEAIGAAQPGTAIVKIEGPAGPAGHTPTVAMTGDQLVIDGVVVGPHLTGPAGPASNLTVGTVTTGAPGSQAAVSLTGTAPDQKLSLTIPQGAQGSAGQPTAFELRGTGMPEGKVTASPGTYYTDIAGTNGAWRWIKKSGTGTTGWDVMTGDTGWRDLTPYLVNGAMRGGGTPGTDLFAIRRSGQVVNAVISLSLASWRSGDAAISFPRAGFSCQSPYVPDGYNNPPSATLAATATMHDFKVYAAITSQGLRWQWSWITSDAWPTTLP